MLERKDLHTTYFPEISQTEFFSFITESLAADPREITCPITEAELTEVAGHARANRVPVSVAVELAFAIVFINEAVQIPGLLSADARLFTAIITASVIFRETQEISLPRTKVESAAIFYVMAFPDDLAPGLIYYKTFGAGATENSPVLDVALTASAFIAQEEIATAFTLVASAFVREKRGIQGPRTAVEARAVAEISVVPKLAPRFRRPPLPRNRKKRKFTRRRIKNIRRKRRKTNIALFSKYRAYALFLLRVLPLKDTKKDQHNKSVTKTWTQKITIRITSNNIFCTLASKKPSGDLVLQAASAGKYRLKVTKKRLKHQYKPFLKKFFAKIWPRLGLGNLMIFITAPIRLRKKIISLLPKLRSYRLKAKKKCGRRAIFIKVCRKKCFNGCQSPKKRRKKRKGIRLTK